MLTKSIWNHKVPSILSGELAPLTHDVKYSKFLRYGENIGDKKVSVGLSH